MSVSIKKHNVRLDEAYPNLSRRDEMKVARHEMPGILVGTIRPVGDGLTAALGSATLQSKERRAQPTDHTVPYGTVPLFERIPGSKLPGYHHPVPSGLNPIVP